MGRRTRIAVLAAVLATVVSLVPSAGAHGPMGGTENVKLTLPPDGSGTADRSTMPSKATTGTIGYTEASDDADFAPASATRSSLA
jgi:hypothetical protein